MIGTLASLLRLGRAGIVLARRDALLPREYHEAMPWGLRLFARAARLIADPQTDKNPGARFARALEALGPAYVKFGQILSTRSDIVGPVFAAGLASLKDRMAPFSQRAALDAIEAEFGRPWTELYSDIGPAVAAASVAQVHRARTTCGRDVAVKILRPGIERAIVRDIAAFRLGAKLAEMFAADARRLRPRDLVETIARASTLELDLRLEAAGASEIDEFASSLPGFAAPQVDWSRSGKRVLTLDWVDGAPLTDLPAVDALGVDRPAMAVAAIQSFLAAALDHGVFHADMHEGNLFARADGTLVAVDFGIVGRIGPGERRYLAEILHGFLTRDYRRIAEVHLEAGYVPPIHSVQDFAGALRAVGEPIFGRKAAEVSMAKVLLQLFEVTRLFDMALRPELVLLQKTMVQVEGVARRLDPDFDMWAAARPIVARWITRELGPEGLAARFAADARAAASVPGRLPRALDHLEAVARALPGAANAGAAVAPTPWLAWAAVAAVAFGLGAALF